MKLIKNKILSKLLFAVLIFLSIYNCSYKNVGYSSGPDLIIESVSIEVISEDGHDRLGMPLMSEHKILDIILRIKNIGTVQFNSPIYIASTSSEQDFRLNYFNSFDFVEPSPTRIMPNESIELRLKKRVDRNSSNIKFQVNYYSDQEKIAKELDYFNNTYSVKY